MTEHYGKEWGYYVYNADILDMIQILHDAAENEKYKLIDEIVNKLSYLIYSKIKKHRGKIFYEDLVQEGKLGLIKAIEDFDPKRGLNFFKFAGWQIKNNIKKFWRCNYRFLTITSKIKEAEREDKIIDNLPILLEEQEGFKILFEEINKLPEIDRRVVMMKFGIREKENTFREIGEIFSLSKQRIEQIKCRAVGKLRKNAKIRKYFIGE